MADRPIGFFTFVTRASKLAAIPVALTPALITAVQQAHQEAHGEASIDEHDAMLAELVALGRTSI